MGKRERARRMKKEGLHEIKNKYRTRAVKKRRKGLVLTAKKKRRALKAGASLSAIFLLILGAFAVGSALLSSVVPNAVPDDFVTVSYELPDDGSDPMKHSALENIGYMNYRFKHQPVWYMEMHGSTVAAGMNQSVNTFKQYSDGVLIMADVTSSAFVKAGRQFCYVGDEVMWRELPKNSSFKANSFEELQKLTFKDDLEAHMTIPAFMAKNGLPGTEFTPYIINEETLEGASEVQLVTSAEWDGFEYVDKPVYQQTYYLRAGDSENLGAAAHYANQMAFTGGLKGLPEFSYITVTYTFDSSWQVLRAEVNESYKANVGFSVKCTSDFTSNYEYGTERAKTDVYEDYFKDFVGKGIEDDLGQSLDALGCITTALLTKPVTFELELKADGKKTNGIISLDASKLDIEKITGGGSIDIGAAIGCIGLKAKIGDIYIYLEDSTAYLAVGGLKAKLPIDDLLAMITGGTAKAAAEPATEESGEGASVFDLDDPVVSEDGTSATVSAKLDLTSLGVDLKMPLNFKFRLDETRNASLETLDISLSYQGIEAEIRLKETSKSVPELKDRDSFIDLYPYAETVYSLVAGGKLQIGLDYANADMRLLGNIGMDFVNGFKLAGALTLNVRGSAKTVELAILDGVAYLNLDGIKIAASLSDALKLVKGFLPAAGSDSGELKNIIDKVLGALFDNDLAALLSLTDEENALTLGVKGTELLAAFGVNYELGDVNLRIDQTSGEITATLDGREVLTVKALEKDISLDTAGYTELTKYAQTLVNMFTGDSVTVAVSYENKLGGKTLAIDGNIIVGLAPLSVSGEITLTYGALEKGIKVVYDNDVLYLVIDSLKVKANTKEAISVISSLISKDEEEETDVYTILEKVLAVDFGEVLSIFETKEEENATLNAVINGTKLLSLFGVESELGEITLTVNADSVNASALGANLSLTAGGESKVLSEEEKAAYVDLKPVIDALPEIFNKKALTVNGKVVLSVGDTDILLSLDNGVLSFKNGFEAYFDLSLVMQEATLNLELYINTERVKLALGNLGAEVEFSRLSTLGDKVASLYEEVRKTLNPISEQELLPEAKTIGDIFGLLKDLLPASDDKGIDGVLSQLSIENSKEKNGLFAVKFMGVSLDVINEAEGFIGAKVRFENESLSVSGELSTAVYAGETPEMPAIGYLGTDDFIELLDYLAAAVHTLAESNLNLTVSGVIGSDDEKYPDGVKYELSGDIRLYSGEATAVHLNVDKKSLWVDSETYVYANVALVPVLEEEQGLYLEFFLLDCDEEAKQDGILDLFVSVSLFGENDTRRNPFTLYAPVDEIMPLLSSALALIGVDGGVIKDYVLAPWLSLETTEQLKGFGNSFKPLLSGLLGGSEETEKTAFDVNALVSSVTVEENTFSLALDSKTIFGKEGEPLKITIGKEWTENGSRLSSLAVENIGNTSVSVKLGYGNEGKVTPAPSFKSSICLNGIASLIQTIARSTTHRVEGDVISGEEAQHEYVLNENFYIDGSIQLDMSALGLINAKIDIKHVAFSITVDEEGVWGVNVRFEYDALKLAGITAINGNTKVYLTGKDNMFYIRREQTTDPDGNPFAKSIVLYRAMPLNNFVNDLINQAAFMFNLGSKITDLLKNVKMGGGNAEKQAVDLGKTVSNLLKSIDYTKGENGETWVVTLNGAGLTGNTLGDIVISLGSDGDGKLRTLTAHTSLSATGISMAIDANLTYRNPYGVMDEGVEDVTKDIAALLIDGMSHKLETVDWAKTTFIEGEFTSVGYVLAGEVIMLQDIVISTGAAGDAKGTVYGTLAYPDLTAYDTEKGYKAEWEKIYGADEALPENKQIFASYRPLTFELTFNFDAESVTLVYEYGNKEFELPFRENEVTRVKYFTDGEGNEYRTAEDLKALSGNTTLTAVYEAVKYTVTFVVDDERSVQNAYYGDAVAYPASPEKVGYTFAGWDMTPETVTESLEITALWTANEYAVTLVSKYEVEGFDWTEDENGSFTATLTFVYDGKVSLPRGVKVEVGDKIFVLRGFCTGADGVCYFEYLPNVTENTVFTAQWEELGFDLVFVNRDGSKTVLNYHVADIIASSALPAIAAREGYTSYWQTQTGSIVTGDYYVTGEASFTVVDIANTYSVTLVSSQPYAGFESVNGVYTKTLSYTYGGAAVALDTLDNISGYWFKGYYTKENGEGEKLDSVAGILEDTTLYVYWQDNTVTVRIYSDLRFGGSVFDLAKNGFYKEYSFNDTYDLSDSIVPAVDGYQTLALFHLGESWVKVDNVQNLNGADLWVFWIQNINVKITEFYTNDVAGGSAYNIGGTVEGALPFGKMSNLIYDELRMSENTKTEATFYIRGAQANDSVDNCGEKKTITVSYKNESVIGTFLGENMNSWDYRDIWPAPRATYGGVIITKTFEYGGKTITTTNGAVVSLDTYTVTYVAERVTEIKEIRIDCPFDEYDCRVFADELAAANGIECPAREGYKGAWPHEEVRGNMTVTPEYTPEAYPVRFESTQKIEGWTEENGKYYFECEMDYDAPIVFYFENELLASYTVGKVNDIVLPVLTNTQKWGAIEIAAGSARFYAQRNVDTVVYNSEIPFDFDGVLYDSLLHEVTGDYSLIAPTAAGYTFLGWYRNVNGVWEEVTALYPTEDEEKISVSVQALWVSDLSVEITRNDWEYIALKVKYDYWTDVKVTGGKLVGAMASEIGSGALDYRFYVSKKDNYDSSASNESASAAYSGEGATRSFYCRTGSYNYGHVIVKLSYEYNGKVFLVGNDLGNETGVHVSQKY